MKLQIDKCVVVVNCYFNGVACKISIESPIL